MACRIPAKKSCSSNLFWGGPKPGCSDRLHVRIIESYNCIVWSYPGEISHPNSANRELYIDISVLVLRRRKVAPNEELSYGVRVMALYWSKIVHPSRITCLKTVQRKSFKRGNILVLRPVLPKIAYFNSANRQLSIAVLHKELRQRKIVDPSRAAP